MPIKTEAFHVSLDRAIEQLYYENEQDRADEQCALDAAMPQPQAQGYDAHGQRKFLAEGGFFPESPAQAAHAGPHGADQPGGATGLVSINDYTVGFHRSSSCFAARTSSSRRTGMVCGALVRRSGS